MLRRPLGIVILSALYILGGLFAATAFILPLATFITLQGESSPLGQTLQAAAFIALFSALPLTLLGIAFIVLGYKLLKGSRYAYYAATAISALGLASSLFAIKLAGAAVSALVLIYLLKPSTRQYFLSKEEVQETEKTAINTERREELAEAKANI